MDATPEVALKLDPKLLVEMDPYQQASLTLQRDTNVLILNGQRDIHGVLLKLVEKAPHPALIYGGSLSLILGMTGLAIYLAAGLMATRGVDPESAARGAQTVIVSSQPATAPPVAAPPAVP
jgi:hypothetical protein